MLEVWYDTRFDHLVVLYWIGSRFYTEYEDKNVFVKGTSKRNGDPLKEYLVYVGEL